MLLDTFRDGTGVLLGPLLAFSALLWKMDFVEYLDFRSVILCILLCVVYLKPSFPLAFVRRKLKEFLERHV